MCRLCCRLELSTLPVSGVLSITLMADKGIAKVAKKLGVSYAEAVVSRLEPSETSDADMQTSFEFRKQRATPVVTGIVVAAEKEEEVLAAYWESNAAAEERERAKREERALKRWAKLINGLRIRRRLRAEYGEVDDVSLRTLVRV